MRSRFNSPAMVTSKRGMKVNEILSVGNWERRLSDESNLDPRLLEGAQILLWGSTVGDDFMQRRGRSNEGKAAAAEFAGVADRDGTLGNFDHYPIDLSFQQVWSAQTEVDVKAIH